ncbi:MAG TPA: helix-turn-helix transcriptional regulator [Bordetella sp.]|nr:helix-turn-helix transcriptional regulator [Bordetella sp.]
MTLAQRLRARMLWRGIKSQNQLARISGVPQSSIHRILTRKDAYSPARSTLLRLAHALDTTVPWLTDGVDTPAYPIGIPLCPSVDATAPDGYAAELYSLMSKMPADARKKVVAIVRLIANGIEPPASPNNTAH